MAYKQFSPIPIVSGGTGSKTLGLNGVLIGNTLSAITATVAGTTGQVLTGITGSAPTFQAPAASSISISGDSGGALSGAAFTFTGSTTGLTFAGSGSTETLGGTLVVANGGTGVGTLTSHGVLLGNGTSAVSATAVGATGTVLIGTSASAPSFSATPNVTSISFGAGSSLSSYVTFTSYTVTYTGATTAGTTTYSVQSGFYSRIGNLIFVQFAIQVSAATGTGNVSISLPFASNSGGPTFVGSVFISGGSYTYPAGITSGLLYVTPGVTNALIIGGATLTNGAFFSIQNTLTTIYGSIVYSV